jgi:hypothetical protein
MLTLALFIAAGGLPAYLIFRWRGGIIFAVVGVVTGFVISMAIAIAMVIWLDSIGVPAPDQTKPLAPGFTGGLIGSGFGIWIARRRRSRPQK